MEFLTRLVPGLPRSLSAFNDPVHRVVLSRTLALLIVLLVFAAAGFVVMRYLSALLLRRSFGVKLPPPRRTGAVVAGTLLGLYAAAAAYAFFIEPDWVRVTKLNVPTRKLKSGQTVRIAQISDLHLDSGSARRSRRATAILKREHPDIIVVTGDLTNDWEPAVQRRLLAFAEQLVSIAPTYAAVGNWDHPQSLQLIESAGVQVLENRASDVAVGSARLRLAGIDYTRPDQLERLLPDRSTFQVVLSHTPYGFKCASQLGVDLYLCGHTHGGQVRLPFYGTICSAYNLVGRYQAGQYRLGRTLMYVNRGLGLEGGSPELRFWCWPEVTVVEVRGQSVT